MKLKPWHGWLSADHVVKLIPKVSWSAFIFSFSCLHTITWDKVTGCSAVFVGAQTAFQVLVTCNPLHLELQHKDRPHSPLFILRIHPLNSADMQHRAIVELQCWWHDNCFVAAGKLWLDPCLKNTFVWAEFRGPHKNLPQTAWKRRAETKSNTETRHNPVCEKMNHSNSQLKHYVISSIWR